MTRNEKKQAVFEVAKILVNKDGYIKGHGDKIDRVMTGDHSPVKNIPRMITKLLKHNNLLVADGLIFKPTPECKLLTNALEIIIPTDIDL